MNRLAAKKEEQRMKNRQKTIVRIFFGLIAVFLFFSGM
jgi:hypothetical protein